MSHTVFYLNTVLPKSKRMKWEQFPPIHRWGNCGSEIYSHPARKWRHQVQLQPRSVWLSTVWPWQWQWDETAGQTESSMHPAEKKPPWVVSEVYHLEYPSWEPAVRNPASAPSAPWQHLLWGHTLPSYSQWLRRARPFLPAKQVSSNGQSACSPRLLLFNYILLPSLHPFTGARLAVQCEGPLGLFLLTLPFTLHRYFLQSISGMPTSILMSASCRTQINAAPKSGKSYNPIPLWWAIKGECVSYDRFMGQRGTPNLSS